MIQHNFHIYIMLFSIAFTLPFSASAQIIKKSDQFHDCMVAVDLGAFKNSQWGACYIDEQHRLETRLNLELRKVINESSDEQKSLVLVAHDQWQRYQESWCKYQESLPFPPTPYVNHLACLVDLAIEQLNKVIWSQNSKASSRPSPTD